ncbi:hypothetical protein EWM64_g4604 [Hericium alpestre]|uniref:Ferric reductase NAD binding domain-containing protein n=1 Tax=Hericium alpestre TaxID=135208 RepID=A0A4Y9ZXV1_9AGAM|nr:hypothetical protein EWM64_g4604 [Hericium alpestre]
MSLVPRDLCQIDIFVTNFKLPAKGPPLSPYSPYDPVTPITPSATDRDELAPPKAGFMKDNRRKQNRASVDSDDGQDSDDSQVDNYVDLSYYTGEFQGGRAAVPEGELGHEEDILDLTNFDGDNDERMPGEAQVNRTVRKEGKMRRALTRKGWKSKSRRNLESYAGDSALKVPSWSEDPPSLKSRLSDSVKLVTSRHGHGHKSSEMDLGMSSIKEADELSPSTTIQPSPRDSKGSSITSPPQTSSALPEPGHQPSLSLAIDSDARSVYSVASDMRDLLPQVGIGARGVQVQLEVDDREMHDISVMAEFARPGRPKLDLILKDEVAKSTGSLVVACCGPTTLNAVMRKLVAAQIDPARIRCGDMSGSISFVAEDFAY